MNHAADTNGWLIWATRGRTWGFRFLLDGGLANPLPAYDRAFAGHEDGTALCHRVGGSVALRFLDPEGRRDTAGRLIPHEFVVMGEHADEIATVEDGLSRIWSLVSDFYARVWDAEGPT